MRVGLVGCGDWGRHILRDLRSLGCEVPVVARSEASIERAQIGGADAILPSIFSLEGVDGVVVASTTVAHAELAEAALELGVPVFVEKPLCPDVAAARRLAALAPERLFVMDKWRYHPGVLALAEIAHSGRLGAVRGLRTTRVGWGNRHAHDVDSIWVLAPHDLAIALEILGRVLTPSSAVAQLLDGVPLSLVGELGDERLWHVLDISERVPVSVRRIELHCDDGVAVLEGGWSEHISIYRAGAEPDGERVEAPGELPLLAELRAFVEHLRGGPPPRSSAAEGARAVETIARLRELAGIE
jgi:predicted dehydrogenase